MKNIKDKSFEQIKHHDEHGSEFWLARELQSVLDYKEWRNFERVIDTAKIACKISQQEVANHFIETVALVEMAVGGKAKLGIVDVNISERKKLRKVKDYQLSRYACYLIVMNGDPRKEVIAAGQTYFAVKTRQQEYQEIYAQLTEDERRLFLRSEIKQKNQLLFEAAKRAGVKEPVDYAIFQDFGYMGLYNGLKARDIANRKNLAEKDNILDHMGSAELGANIFRITQTEDILKRDNISTQDEANETHFRVGSTVRKAIAELGGTMPENQPLPGKSILELEKETKKKIKTN